jgi:D-sedoheptulose 7-phosphate isomerase
LKTAHSSKLFDDLFHRHPALQVCRTSIFDAYTLLREAYESGKKLLVAGNGGSAADSEHIVGELMKSFLFRRNIAKETALSLEQRFGEDGALVAAHLEGSLPAIPLPAIMSLSTAFLNDSDPLTIYAQMVYGYGQPGDIFWGISTSGNSKNILYAAMTAKAKGMKCIGLTGQKGGKLKSLCDVAVCVPEEETFKIQELHLPVYHAVCAMLEADIFGASDA